MKSEERRDFNKDSRQWDANLPRVQMAGAVAEAMIKEIDLSTDLDVLDFGCGTGLVTLRLQPFVGTITGADSSPGMLAVLEEKIESLGLTNIHTALVDFEKGDRITGKFHLIVSSMTLHHVPDTAALFSLWYDLLLPGGRLCFADLDTEDGSFHADNTGVFHLGFDRERLAELLRDAGYRDVHASTATRAVRNVEGKGNREFSVFLITARKLFSDRD